jgi:hypothetical protein
VVVIENSHREIEIVESKDQKLIEILESKNQMLTEKRHRKIKKFIDESKSLENAMVTHKK